MANERSTLAAQLAAMGAQRSVPAPLIADSAASAAGLEGAGGGLLSRALGGAKLGSLAKAGGLRAGGLGALGYFGGNALIPEDHDSSTDNALRNALTGAGVGAGLGTIVPGVGNVVGGLAGGALGLITGGLLGKFGPKDDSNKPESIQAEITKQNATLSKVLAPFQFAPDTQQLFTAQLQSALMNVKDTAGVQAAYQQVATMIPQFVQQDQAVKQQQKADGDRQARAAAMQAMLGPYLQQENDKATQFAQQLAQAQKSAAGFVSDPGLRASYEQQAAAVPLQTASANRDAMIQLALADAAQQAEFQRQQQQQQLAYGQLDTDTQQSVQQQLLRQQASKIPGSNLFGSN